MNILRAMAKGTKKLDLRHLAHLAARLERLKKERFDDNGTALAAYLGLSQSLLSNFLSGDRGLGIGSLIKIRARLDVSLDELLGLPPLNANALPTEIEAAVVRALAKHAAR